MNIAAGILRLFGWKLSVTAPDYPKCIICVAPHTSNWDFILGELAYASVHRRASFLMKETWFFWPLGCFFRSIGGIPVPRRHGGDLTRALVEKFEHSDRLALAVTPEGTRSRVERWRTGFLYIATKAHVPILLGVLDFKSKTINVDDTYMPTGNIDADMAAIKRFYSERHPQGKYPQKFTADYPQ